MKAAVIFERDGVLNHARVDRQSQASPLTLDEFRIRDEAIASLHALKSAGFLLLSTTHQPGLSRGTLSRRELDLMHGILKKRLNLDDILLCPHDEDDRCPCRKPKPGLLQEAAFKWHLDLDRCYVVSDKWQDAAAAHNAGCTSLLIKSPWNGSGHRDYLVADFPAAICKILQLQMAALSRGVLELTEETVG